MGKTSYITVKAIMALSAISLFFIGVGFIFISLRDTYNNTHPQGSTLLYPGIVIMLLFLIPFLCFILLKKKHNVYIHYAAAMVSLLILGLTLNTFIL